MKTFQPIHTASYKYLVKRSLLYSFILAVVVIGVRAGYYFLGYYLYKWFDRNYAGDVEADPSIATGIDTADWMSYSVIEVQDVRVIAILLILLIGYSCAAIEYLILRSKKQTEQDVALDS